MDIIAIIEMNDVLANADISRIKHSGSITLVLTIQVHHASFSMNRKNGDFSFTRNRFRIAEPKLSCMMMVYATTQPNAYTNLDIITKTLPD